MNQEQEDEKVRSDLLELASYVEEHLPKRWGFVVLAFPFGAGGRLNYISNAQRADIVRAMYEFIEATKEKWGEHVPESAAAEDEELGRARQRIAELERLSVQAADTLVHAHEHRCNETTEEHDLKLAAKLRKAAQS